MSWTAPPRNFLLGLLLLSGLSSLAAAQNIPGGTCPTGSTTVKGCFTVDGTTITATGGVLTAVGAAASLTVGSSTITGGTTTRVLFDNAGVLGEYTISGTGNVAMTTSPVFTTPNLGTPSAATLTNATGLPISGIAGLGTGVGTFLATPSSANLLAALTTSTGTGSAVFGTSPSLTTPTIAGATLSGTLAGTPTFSGNLTFSGAPVFSGTLTGTQTQCLGLTSGNVLAASSGACGSGGSSAFNALTSGTNTTAAMVVGSGATLSATGSGTITATAVAVGGITGLGSGVATFLATPSSANLLSAMTTSTGTGNLAFATNPTLVGATLTGTLALGTQTVSGGFTMSGVPLMTGLSSGTQVSILGLDSGNHIVTGSLSSASGMGVATGESVSTINNTSSTLSAGHYIIQTVTAQFSAARTTTLPTASAFGQHLIYFQDQYISGLGCAINGANTWAIKPNGTDTINGVTGTSGEVILNVPCSGAVLESDGTSNWGVLGQFPAGTSGGIPYYSAVGQVSSSALLAANALVIGGGAGAAPATTTTGTGVLTAIGNNVNTNGGLLTASTAAIASNAIVTGAGSGTALTGTTPGTGVLTALGNNTDAASGLCTVGTSGATCGLLNGTNTFSGAQTFGEVLGTVTSQSGATYTLANTDCGTEVDFTDNSAVTVTIPATLPVGCNIAILQAGTAKVSVNGSAVTAATLHSAHSYTGTSAQWAIIGINIEANSGGSSAVAILTGDGA